MAAKTYTVTMALPDGRRKYFRGNTRKEAEEKREEAKLLLGKGVSFNCSTTVAELAELWFKAFKKDQLHIRSEETIRGTLNRYVLPSLGEMQVCNVKPIHIQMMMAKHSGYSKSTQKKILQSTKAIFLMAEENSLILRSPVSTTIKAGGADPEEQVPLTQEQSDLLLDAIRGTRAYLLVLILLHSGLRIGEALGLKWRDIDTELGTLTVQRSIVYPEANRKGIINDNMKTKSAQRTIPLPWYVIDEIKKEEEKSKSEYVFSMQSGKYLSYNSFRSLWRIIEYRTKGESTGKEIIERTLDFSVHPHQLRHTCVTRWFESGLDIKEVQHLAGHATPDITLKIYTHYQESLRCVETANKIRSSKYAKTNASNQ